MSSGGDAAPAARVQLEAELAELRAKLDKFKQEHERQLALGQTREVHRWHAVAAAVGVCGIGRWANSRNALGASPLAHFIVDAVTERMSLAEGEDLTKRLSSAQDKACELHDVAVRALAAKRARASEAAQARAKCKQTAAELLESQRLQEVLDQQRGAAETKAAAERSARVEAEHQRGEAERQRGEAERRRRNLEMNSSKLRAKLRTAEQVSSSGLCFQITLHT